MVYLISKFFFSAALLVLISEIAKRSTLMGGLLAALPLTSLLAMVWLYADTKNTLVVAALARDIFWMVLPSLVLFIVLPLLLRRQVPFYAALLLASTLMMLSYSLTVFLLKKWGVIG